MKQENSEIGKRVLTDGLDNNYEEKQPFFKLHSFVLSNIFIKMQTQIRI